MASRDLGASHPSPASSPSTRADRSVPTYAESDWPDVWSIIRVVVRAGETFLYDPSMTSAEAHDIWIEEPPGLTVVGVVDERIVGTAKMGANRAGPDRTSRPVFMVAVDARGRGCGTALCEFVLDWARERTSPASSSTPLSSQTMPRIRSTSARPWTLSARSL